MLVSGVGWVACTRRAARPSGRRRVSVRGAFAPRKVLAKPFSWFRADLESSDQAPDIVWFTPGEDQVDGREKAAVRKMVVAMNSLLVLLLATPSLHGSAGVWQFPAYGPSPRPLETPTPRVARAAIPKDLVSGITVKSFNPSLIVI